MIRQLKNERSCLNLVPAVLYRADVGLQKCVQMGSEEYN